METKQSWFSSEKDRYYFTFKFAKLTWRQNEDSISPHSISPLIELMTQLAGWNLSSIHDIRNSSQVTEMKIDPKKEHALSLKNDFIPVTAD